MASLNPIVFGRGRSSNDVDVTAIGFVGIGGIVTGGKVTGGKVISCDVVMVKSRKAYRKYN